MEEGTSWAAYLPAGLFSGVGSVLSPDYLRFGITRQVARHTTITLQGCGQAWLGNNTKPSASSLGCNQFKSSITCAAEVGKDLDAAASRLDVAHSKTAVVTAFGPCHTSHRISLSCKVGLSASRQHTQVQQLIKS